MSLQTRLAAVITAIGLDVKSMLPYASRWPTFAEVTGKPAQYAPAPHTHAAADVTSGTFAAARISQASVTQHQSALAIDWSQVFNAGNLGIWRTRTPEEFANAVHQHSASDITSGILEDARFPDRLRLAGSLTTGDDCDLTIESGFYRIGASTANTPTGAGPSGSTMIVSGFSSGIAHQTFHRYRNATSEVYVRHRHASSGWTPWVRQMTAGDTLAWSLLSDVPDTASRWPTWGEVSGKPAQYAPSPHTHSAADIQSGTLAYARLPEQMARRDQSAEWAGGQTFNGGVTAAALDVPGTSLFGDGMRFISSSGSNYIQSGATRTSNSWQNLRIAPYGSTAYNLEIRATGIHVTGRVDADQDIMTQGNLASQNGRVYGMTGSLDLISNGTGGLRLMPNGYSTAGQTQVTTDGALLVSQDVQAGRYLNVNNGRIYAGAGYNLDIISPLEVRFFAGSSYSTNTMVSIGAGGSLTATSTISDSIGDVRIVPSAARNSNITIPVAETGRSSIKTTTGNRTFTVPAGIARDWVHTVINDSTGGSITITPASGVTLIRGTTSGSVVLSPGESVTLVSMPSNNRVRVLG